MLESKDVMQNVTEGAVAEMGEGVVNSSANMFNNIVSDVKNGTNTGHVIVGGITAAVLAAGWAAWKKWGTKK